MGKDETEGIPIIEFVGLRAKMYSIKTPVVKKDKMRAKGVIKAVTKEQIKHDDFKTSCLICSFVTAFITPFALILSFFTTGVLMEYILALKPTNSMIGIPSVSSFILPGTR